MKRVVVTGGAGFIGSNLGDALLHHGFEVHAVDTLQGGREDRLHTDVHLHRVDIRDYETLAELFSSLGDIYCLFHTAALPRVQFSIEHPRETHAVNVDGTLNVLVASRDAGIRRVVYSASSSAYGDQNKLPLTEDMPAMPKSPYGLQKYIGELLMKLFYDIYKLPTVSLRYFNVYGPKLDPEGPYALVIGKFLKQRKAGEPLTLTGDGTQTRDFTHVSDVVRANILAMESTKVGNGEVINIGAGANTSINELAKLIGGDVQYIPPRLEPHDTLADRRKAKELLDWEPLISLKEGITELKSIFDITD